MRALVQTPYPNSTHRQFQMLWWILAGNFILFLLTLALVMRAGDALSRDDT